MDMKQYWECSRKRCHPTRESAAKMAAHIRRCTSGGSILAPYHCRFCGQWHLAHRSRPVYYINTGWELAKAS